MNFIQELSEEQRLIHSAAVEFAKKEVEPLATKDRPRALLPGRADPQAG